MGSILEVKDLKKNYGDLAAVNPTHPDPRLPAQGWARFIFRVAGSHTERAVAPRRYSQLSGSEQDSHIVPMSFGKHPSELRRQGSILIHVSTEPSRNVPGYACPFTQQTEHI